MVPLRAPKDHAPGQLPRWVTFLDLLGVGLIVLTVVAFTTGGYRFESDALIISVTSWQRLGIWSAVVIGARHLLWRRPTLLDRLRLLRPYLDRSRDALGLVALAAGSRLGALLVSYLGVVVVLTAADDHPFASGLDAWRPPVDSETWLHLSVAQDGYAALPASRGVFPAVGWLVRLQVWLLGVDPITAGVSLSIVSFVAGMFYLRALARTHLRAEDTLAPVAMLAAFPWSFTHSLVGADGLFLLAAVAGFYHARVGQFSAAAPWALLAGLTRPAGFLVSLPLALAAWKPGTAFAASEGRTGAETLAARKPGATAVLAAVAPVAGLAAALVYAGDWGSLFGRMPAGRLVGAGGLFDSLETMIHSGPLSMAASMPFAALDAASALFAALLCGAVTRRLGPAYGLFVVLCLAASLAFGAEPTVGRQGALLFPLFLWMGARVPEHHRYGWLSVFAMLQALLAVLFFAAGTPR
jgi:hypothetical protein